ncbi:MAG: hypothetical protein RLY31_2173 [Bacteroidota bacterium]|jgi:AraC-like DNA-binding protein
MVSPQVRSHRGSLCVAMSGCCCQDKQADGFGGTFPTHWHVMTLSDKLCNGRKLETLVENRTTHHMDPADLHLFETHKQAEQVVLQFDQPVLASMQQGKKVMHLSDHLPFEFLPGESLILPSREIMTMDFPEARLDQPTRCLAMTIDESRIRSTVALLNEQMPRLSGTDWTYREENFHFTNDTAIQQLIQRLIFLFTEDHPSRDVFTDLLLRELVIRILQLESRTSAADPTATPPRDNRLSFIIRYMREHLDEPLPVTQLSHKVYMSESNFYRVFRHEMGLSPTDFILRERMKRAVSLLQDPNNKGKDVCLQCGFNSLSYFIRAFKRDHHLSPRAYQARMQQGPG